MRGLNKRGERERERVRGGRVKERKKEKERGGKREWEGGREKEREKEKERGGESGEILRYKLNKRENGRKKLKKTTQSDPQI